MNRQRRQENRIYRKRKRRKIKKAAHNYILNNLSKEDRSYYKSSGNSIIPHRLTLVVPRIFCTSTALNVALEFIARCKSDKVLSKKILNFDFKKVSKLNAGALSLLLSVVHDLMDLRIRCRGNFPSSLSAKKEFIDSGFLEYFELKGGAGVSKNKILVIGDGKVDQQRTGQEIMKAMKTVTGVASHNQALQGALIEMMANSINHAFPGHKKAAGEIEPLAHTKRWYLSVFHNEDANEVQFSFIDNGTGILKTIQRGPFKKIVDLLKETEILQNAFKGDYQSSTHLKERGHGLPTIKKAFGQNAISTLCIVTNDYVYKLENEVINKLTTSFEGTCYFWKLDKTCVYGNT